MNYTEKYHLPQWEETDRIMRTDFNQMCADMEAGIMDARGRAERGDEAVKALTAKAQTDANNAQITANTALSKANAAYSPSQQPYVIGVYQGDSDSLTVTLGFRPRFLLISGQYAVKSYNVTYPTGFVLVGSGAEAEGVTLLNDGFMVYNTRYDSGSCPPHLNTPNKKYAYIAFR